MSITNIELRQLAKVHQLSKPALIINEAVNRYANIAISFSGAEDVILIDIALKIKADIPVFSLDTGRLHPATYNYIETIRNHYGIEIEILSPEAEPLQTLVQQKGLFSFYQDGHKECCTIRKVAPLRKKLATIDAWITGQRTDQSPDTRTTIAVAEDDTAFSTEGHPLAKFNPLAAWSSADVWRYIHTNNVPYNPLHAQGFTSIGCEPCTRAILPNQQEREGRWWWEDVADKECGLHSGNVAQQGA